MEYLVPVCLILMCIGLLVGGVFVRLAVSAAIVGTIAHILTRKTRHKSAGKHSRPAGKPRHKPIFGGAPGDNDDEGRANIEERESGPIGRPNLNTLVATMNESKYKKYYKKHDLFKNTIMPDYCGNLNGILPPKFEYTYIVVPDDFLRLLRWFKTVKREWCKKVYGTIYDVDEGVMITRLMTNRSLVFNDDEDRHITRSLLDKDTVTTEDHPEDDRALEAVKKYHHDMTKAKYHFSADVQFGKFPNTGCTVKRLVCPDTSKFKTYIKDSKYYHSLLDNLEYLNNYDDILDDTMKTTRDNCDKVRQMYPSINDTLSYDEMLLSALCGMSSYTRFRNTGRRDNRGGPVDDTLYEHDGVLVGLVGERFETDYQMGWRTMLKVTTIDENTVEGIVMKYIDNLQFGRNTNVNITAEDLEALMSTIELCEKITYSRQQGSEQEYTKASSIQICPDEKIVYDNETQYNMKYIRNSDGTTTEQYDVYGKPISFNENNIDLKRFMKRLSIPMKLLLEEAVRRSTDKKYGGKIDKSKRKPYVVASGLGSGVWSWATDLGGEVIDILNVYALILLIADRKYDCIPIIEFRRYGESPAVIDYVKKAMTELVRQNTATSYVDKENLAIWKIHNNRYFIYRQYNAGWDPAKSVLSIYREFSHDTSDDGTKIAGAYEQYIENRISIALLIALFAWDSNSYVGNEFWCGAGHLGASADPAAVCCSDIGITMNPDFNTRLKDASTRIYNADRYTMIPAKINSCPRKSWCSKVLHKFWHCASKPTNKWRKWEFPNTAYSPMRTTDGTIIGINFNAVNVITGNGADTSETEREILNTYLADTGEADKNITWTCVVQGNATELSKSSNGTDKHTYILQYYTHCKNDTILIFYNNQKYKVFAQYNICLDGRPLQCFLGIIILAVNHWVHKVHTYIVNDKNKNIYKKDTTDTDTLMFIEHFLQNKKWYINSDDRSMFVVDYIEGLSICCKKVSHTGQIADDKYIFTYEDDIGKVKKMYETNYNKNEYTIGPHPPQNFRTSMTSVLQREPT